MLAFKKPIHIIYCCLLNVCGATNLWRPNWHLAAPDLQTGTKKSSIVAFTFTWFSTGRQERGTQQRPLCLWTLTFSRPPSWRCREWSPYREDTKCVSHQQWLPISNHPQIIFPGPPPHWPGNHKTVVSLVFFFVFFYFFFVALQIKYFSYSIFCAAKDSECSEILQQHELAKVKKWNIEVSYYYYCKSMNK